MKFAYVWVPMAVMGMALLTGCESIRIANDDAAIRAAVFKDNVLSHSVADAGKYQVYFLDVAGDREAIELKSFFATNTPSVVCGTNQALYTKKGVFDRWSGSDGQVFSVEIQSVEYPNASVLAEAYAGPNVAEVLYYSLVSSNNEWIVTEKTADDPMDPDQVAQ